MFHYTRNFYYIEFKQLDNHSYPKEGFNEIKNLEFSRFGKTHPRKWPKSGEKNKIFIVLK